MGSVWGESWPVIGTSGKEYKVSKKKTDGTFGCTCPAWINQSSRLWVNGIRRDCQHILQIKLRLNYKEPQKLSNKKAVVEDQIRAVEL